MGQVNQGVHGFVTSSADGSPLEGAIIQVLGISHNITSSKDGDFWRLLAEGTYDITVSKEGYQPHLIEGVRVTNSNEATRVNFTLHPNNNVVASDYQYRDVEHAYDARVSDDVTGNYVIEERSGNQRRKSNKTFVVVGLVGFSIIGAIMIFAAVRAIIKLSRRKTHDYDKLSRQPPSFVDDLNKQRYYDDPDDESEVEK